MVLNQMFPTSVEHYSTDATSANSELSGNSRFVLHGLKQDSYIGNLLFCKLGHAVGFTLRTTEPVKNMVGMAMIFLYRTPFQILQRIVGFVPVYMVALKSLWGITNESNQNQAVNEECKSNTILTELNQHVSTAEFAWFPDSVISSIPSNMAHDSSKVAGTISAFKARNWLPNFRVRWECLWRHVQSFCSRLTVQASGMADTIRSPFSLHHNGPNSSRI